MGKTYFEREIKERVNELDSLEDVLNIGSLTLNSYVSSSRTQMLASHLVQALVPDNPEVPGVCTTFEHMYGEFSTSYYRTDTRLSVIKKISKYDNHVYILLVKDKSGKYDIIKRNDVKYLAEQYGYRYKNDAIDSVNVGDTIPKDTVLYSSPCMDEYGNYMYGVNAKVMYATSQETIEDAIVVSESFAKKLSVTKVDTCKVMLNDNDIFLNLFGNNSTYKAFPNIGEKMKDSILCGTRKKNKQLDQYYLKNHNLRNIFPNDDIYQFYDNYTVMDIDIWTNKDIDSIADIPANQQLRWYMIRIRDYYQEIYDTFKPIIDAGEEYSKAFSDLYKTAEDYLDPGCRYSDDGRVFGNIVIEFKIAKSTKLHRGCKICGRYGNKSVISKVLPDNEMGITEDGVIPDIRMDSLGVLGRLNAGQCIEQELNWIADIVRDRMKDMDDIHDKLDLLYEFLKIVNKDEYYQLKDHLKSLSKKEVKSFIKSIEDDRIYITQSPVYCISGDELYELYQKFEPKKSKIYFTGPDGVKRESIHEVIVADEYILRLKQEPISKISIRSKSLINPRSSLPIKSTKASKHKTIFPDQCSRIGEQELIVLLLSNCADALDYFYRSCSSSIEGRRNQQLFTEDPHHGFKIELEMKNSRSVDMMNVYMKAMGYKLDIEYEDGLQDGDIDVLDVDYDVPDMPSDIRSLFDD